MSDTELSPDNVSVDVFARMLTDAELRPLLGLEVSPSTAETIAASPGLTARYYEQWARSIRSAVPAEREEPARQTTAARVDSAAASAPPRHIVHDIEKPMSPVVAAHIQQPLDLRLGIHALAWPAISLVFIGLTFVLALALARSSDRNLGVQAAEYWTGVGYFFAIVLAIFGVVFGIRSIHQGLTAEGGTPRRSAAIALGAIGLIASVWFAFSWLIGWVTL